MLTSRNVIGFRDIHDGNKDTSRFCRKALSIIDLFLCVESMRCGTFDSVPKHTILTQNFQPLLSYADGYREDCLAGTQTRHVTLNLTYQLLLPAFACDTLQA